MRLPSRIQPTASSRDKIRGHAVMDWLHGAVGRRGQDDEMLAVLVWPAAPRHEQGSSLFPPESELRLAGIPFVESAGRDDGAPVADALPEQGLSRGGLTPGVEDQPFSGGLLQGKAPPQPGAAYTSACGQEDRGFGCRADVRLPDPLQRGGSLTAQLPLDFPDKLLDFL